MYDRAAVAADRKCDSIGNSIMSGLTDLQTLLAGLKPNLVPGDYVFVTLPEAKFGDGAELEPIAAFTETEGMTLVIPKALAGKSGQQSSGEFRMITLQVHSALDAVGLTAAVADALTKRGISANIIAAYYHDHVFVPSSRADDALDALKALANASADRASRTEVQREERKSS